MFEKAENSSGDVDPNILKVRVFSWLTPSLCESQSVTDKLMIDSMVKNRPKWHIEFGIKMISNSYRYLDELTDFSDRKINLLNVYEQHQQTANNGCDK